MSEVQKPVEEPVVAPTEPVAAETVPTETAAPVEPAATETPAAVEAAKEETPVTAPAKEESKPVEEGALGYKGPGLLKGFIFQKKFFWFGNEPVEIKHLSNYLRGEKPEVANHNGAWSSHTGKGLLFFSKKHTEKATPAGILNLSEVTDLTEEGTVDFFFKIGEHKHTFQAAHMSERDSWVAALKEKIAEAKELAGSVTESETYKQSHSSLAKPFVAGGAAAGVVKAAETKKEEKAEAKEEKKEEKAEAKEEKKEEKKELKEEKKARKSRSASRKRNSIFGSIGFGKKEDKIESPKEGSPAAEEPVAAEAVSSTHSAFTSCLTRLTLPRAPAEATPATTEAAVAAPVAATEAKTETEPSRPAATPKRNSIFGTLKSQFSNKEKKPESEVAPAVPVKDSEPVAESAPVIPAVETTEPLATSVVSPSTAPTETTTVTNGETKAAETPAVKSDKRKSSLPWLSKKKEATTSDEETEKPKSPFAKLRATVKGKTSSKPAAEKTAETAAATEPAQEETPAATAEAAPATSEPVVDEPISAAPKAAPEVAASA